MRQKEGQTDTGQLESKEALMPQYRITVYSAGEVIQDAEFDAFSLLTKLNSEDLDHNPHWARVQRGLNDMEAVGLYRWAYDLATEENTQDNEDQGGTP